MSPETPVLMVVFAIALWLVMVGVTLLVLWAIIRGAVLSALRKHHSETRGAALSQGNRAETF